MVKKKLNPVRPISSDYKKCVWIFAIAARCVYPLGLPLSFQYTTEEPSPHSARPKRKEPEAIGPGPFLSGSLVLEVKERFGDPTPRSDYFSLI
jgi:hypothetical protein